MTNNLPNLFKCIAPHFVGILASTIVLLSFSIARNETSNKMSDGKATIHENQYALAISTHRLSSRIRIAALKSLEKDAAFSAAYQLNDICNNIDTLKKSLPGEKYLFAELQSDKIFFDVHEEVASKFILKKCKFGNGLEKNFLLATDPQTRAILSSAGIGYDFIAVTNFEKRSF